MNEKLGLQCTIAGEITWMFQIETPFNGPDRRMHQPQLPHFDVNAYFVLAFLTHAV